MKKIYSILGVLTGIVLIFVLSSSTFLNNRSSEFEPPSQIVIVTIYGTSLLEDCEDATVVLSDNNSEIGSAPYVHGTSEYEFEVGPDDDTRTICATLTTDCTGFTISGQCKTGIFNGSPDLYLLIHLRKIEN